MYWSQKRNLKIVKAKVSWRALHQLLNHMNHTLGKSWESENNIQGRNFLFFKKVQVNGSLHHYYINKISLVQNVLWLAKFLPGYFRGISRLNVDFTTAQKLYKVPKWCF